MTDVTAKTTSTYNRIAPAYAQRWFSTAALQEQLDRFSHYVRSGGLILDLGCGPGRDILALRDRGFRVIGLDRSPGMLKEAANRGAGPLILADMRQLPFSTETFDGVWSSAAMLHLPKTDFPSTLLEMGRVLNQGQIFVAVKEGQAEQWEGDEADKTRFFAYYQVTEVERILEQTDFEVRWRQVNPDQNRPDTTWINAIAGQKLPLLTNPTTPA
jgi:SAM-dependent methyltransferase